MENYGFKMKNVESILGVDLDNVLCQTDVSIRTIISEIFGIKLKQKDMIYWDYWRCGITKEQNQSVMKRFHETDGEFVELVKGALEALHILQDKFEIHIVTNRLPESKEMTERWLRINNVPYDILEFQEGLKKGRKDYIAFIEDNRENAYHMANEGIRTFLLNYPWNQPKPSDPPNLVRVNSWEEITSLLLTE